MKVWLIVFYLSNEHFIFSSKNKAIRFLKIKGYNNLQILSKGLIQIYDNPNEEPEGYIERMEVI